LSADDAILALAGSLGIRTIAEGLEDFETAQTLLRMGCLLGQGYYYARAMPDDDVSGYIGQSPPLRQSLG
jgi:diguanylate cyclase